MQIGKVIVWSGLVSQHIPTERQNSCSGSVLTQICKKKLQTGRFTIDLFI